jgi:hypothetical protein
LAGTLLLVAAQMAIPWGTGGLWAKPVSQVEAGARETLLPSEAAGEGAAAAALAWDDYEALAGTPNEKVACPSCTIHCH